MKRLFLLLISAILIATLVAPVSVSAADDFKLKDFDKAYVTFVFDDCYETLPSKYKGNFFAVALQMFEDYNFPMCMAATADNAKVDSKRKLLKELEAAGGEVLSHTVDHTVLSKDNSTVEVFEKQLGDSYGILSAYGFKVNGIIATGNNGGENTANFALMEPVTRKYYKYSNLYGVSAQYDYKKLDMNGIQRRWITTFEGAKKIIDEAIEKKRWVVLSAHHFGEIPRTELDAILDYLARNFNYVDVVTWNYIYENFGVYSGPQVPTAEALAKVEQFKKTIIDTDENTSSITSAETENNSSTAQSAISSTTQNSSASQTVVSSETVSSSVEQVTPQDTLTTGEETVPDSNNKLLVAVIILAVVLVLCGVAIVFTVKYIKKSNQ